MRIWVVTTEMFPFAGGIGVYTHQTAKMLAQGGVDVTVLYHHARTERPRSEWTCGYRLIQFGQTRLDHTHWPDLGLHGPLAQAFAICEVLKELIAAEGAPDLVEFPDYGAAAYFFLKHRLLEMGADAPRVVVTAHRPNLHCALSDDAGLSEHRTAFLADAERWSCLAADAIFAPSAFIAADLARSDSGIRAQQLEIVPHPYDTRDLTTSPGDPFVEPLATALRTAQFTLAEPVLFFGKLQVQKGPCEAVASLSALAGEGFAPPIWLFGRDAVHSPTGQATFDVLLRRHARLAAQGGFRYFGAYSLAGLHDLCRLHPICLAPYRAESFSYAAVEIILAGGLPLFSLDGGLGEWAPPEVRDALCVDFFRPGDLGAKLVDLLALDRDQRRRLSAQLRETVLARTDPANVRSAKLDAISKVRLRSTSRLYPFVHGDAISFDEPLHQTRAALAAAVPQAGDTLTIRRVEGAAAANGTHLISVIVPYYEMHAYLDETLASVEAQHYPNIEIIIVDDGSPSPEAQAALDQAMNAPRRFPTLLARKYNGGLADARNAGARLAQGAYLYFLDADDTLHPSALSESLAVLERFDNIAYVGAGLREFGAGDKAWLAWDIDSPYIGFHNLQICAFLIRAEAWLRYGFNDARMDLGMEDYDSHVRMFGAGVRGLALPRLLFNYRIRPTSMSRQFTPPVCAHLYRRLIRNSPDVYRRYGPELVGLFAENGHGAFAPSPTAQSPAHAALFDPEPPQLHILEADLDRQASRARLSLALLGQARSEDTAWAYVAARQLLALHLAPDYTFALLRQAMNAAPDNGWYRLYALIALLRTDRASLAPRLENDHLIKFCRRERDAVDWIANLEGARGFPDIHLRLLKLAGRLETDAGNRPDWLRRLPPSPAPSKDFMALQTATGALLRALRQGRVTRVDILDALLAQRDAALALVSEDGFAALLVQWVSGWVRDGSVGSDVWRTLVEVCMLQPDPLAPLQHDVQMASLGLSDGLPFSKTPLWRQAPSRADAASRATLRKPARRSGSGAALTWRMRQVRPT